MMDERRGRGARDDPLVPLGSSWRCKSAQETLDRARVLMPVLGISRVTDITRMDRLGLPVHASVRPRGKVLRVHAGKGILDVESRVGALMEAIEYAAADPQASAWRSSSMSLGELVDHWAGVHELVDFVPRARARHADDERVETVGCEDIVTGATTQLPAELVFFPFTPTNAPSLFYATTNGLASGNTLEEATLHGLLEVLERDAMSMSRAHDATAWIAQSRLPAPFPALGRAWHDMGIELGVRSVGNPWNLPCFEAALHEPASTDVNIATGSGLHLDAGVAVSRAICEAAQSRLSHIHGGRDDITTFYAKYRDWDADTRARLEMQRVAQLFDNRVDADVDFGATTHRVENSVSEALARVVAKLAATGFGHVLRFRFPIELNGLHAVKVVVPRCENVEHESGRIGARLLERILGRG